jgi:serine/threonine protein kinase
VLIDEDGSARLCDFGLSRMIEDGTLWDTSATSAPGTTRWKAPEILNGEQVTVTAPSDMYAYGMTCFVRFCCSATECKAFTSVFHQEIYTGQIPFQRHRHDFMVIKAVILNKEKPEKVTVSDCCISDKLWGLWMKCWDENPAERPSPAEVLDYISEIKTSSSFRLMSSTTRPIINILSRLDVESILRCGKVSLFVFKRTKMF